MRRTADQTREHVLAIAHDLFYWQGIRATGVDRIAAEAGVAPTTLYRLFASKDDLVAAYLDRAARQYQEWFDAAAAAGGADSRDQILAVFDALIEQVQPHQCRGCPFLMALAEFPEPAHPAHRRAVELKAWVRARWGELSTEDTIADHLALAMEGVYASAQSLGASGPARRARTLAETLLTPVP